MNSEIMQSYRQMIIAAILAIVLGLVMLFYPGGTMGLIAAAFWMLKLIISIFILAYTISEAVRYFRIGIRGRGFIYLIIGILATALVWIFDVRIIYLIVALFFILAGLSEVFASFSLTIGRYFLLFLGLLNILIGAIMLKYPTILPLLIAWYVLFWGISRLFLALEIRKAAP